MIYRISIPTLVLTLLLALSAKADITTYSQDFEALDKNSGSALTDDGWKVFGNVFTPGGGYLYGYGPFDAPNGGAGFSAIADGAAGPGQGVQYLNVYSDYNNGDHGNGNYIDALVFQEQTIGAGDVGPGKGFSMAFDYLANPDNTNNGDSTTFAFMKVLKQSDSSFAQLGVIEFETTGASSSAWASHSMTLAADSSWAGELLQFGFRSYATNYNDTGRFYDNIQLTSIPEPTTAGLLGLGVIGLMITRRRR